MPRTFQFARLLAPFPALARRTAEFSLTRWATDCYRRHSASAEASQTPTRSESLEALSRALASRHGNPISAANNHHLQAMLRDEQAIAKGQALVAAASVAGRPVTAAAEWLLDNHFLIQEQVDRVLEAFPKGFDRRLPRLSGATPPPLRMHALMESYLEAVGGAFDDAALVKFLDGYQAQQPLLLAELWATPSLLRMVLLSRIRLLVEQQSWRHLHREQAVRWAERLGASPRSHAASLRAVADLVRLSPPLTAPFVAQLAASIRPLGQVGALVQGWMEQSLGTTGRTVSALILEDTEQQDADRLTIARYVASLRLLGAQDWHRFVERTSRVEQLFLTDATGSYPRMDALTRDRYRAEVQAFSIRFEMPELEVARQVMALAAAAPLPADERSDLGFYLLDRGRFHLSRLLAGLSPRRLPSQRILHAARLTAYLLPIALLIAGATYLLFGRIPGHPIALLVGMSAAATLAASQFAISLINWTASMLRRPRPLPRMDYEGAIPAEARTLVVIPCLLTDPARVRSLLSRLELRYFANRDPNLWFALLTDFADAETESLPGDAALLEAAEEGIRLLNERFSGDAGPKFFLLHRPRLHNPVECCWMGRERKRGKIEDLNALLDSGATTPFARIVGEVADLRTVKLVITLDADTDLPWGAGWRLVGAAMHPLNLPRMAAGSDHLRRGYAILQPRVAISSPSALRSAYARAQAGEVGIDPYTRVVSDLYHDLFDEASYIGKGIYHVGAFRQLLHGRFPDNAILSHDLIESCYARSGQCSDVELLEDAPTGYLADVSRRHRWMRGDWQIAPWLARQVRDGQGNRTASRMAPLNWWKVFDNLRRSLVPPAYLVLFIGGWLTFPTGNGWSLSLIGLLLLPELLPIAGLLARGATTLPAMGHLEAVAIETERRLGRTALWVALLPFESQVAIDAAVRSWWRMLVSHRRLLEWQTAAEAEAAASGTLLHVLRRMWIGPATALLVALLLPVEHQGDAVWAAVPVLWLWAISPLLVWWVSRPAENLSTVVSADDLSFLRLVARRTWNYFETFVPDGERWLVPDNVQLSGETVTAHRTSPTNLGLSLLANLSAYDLGYLPRSGLLERTARTLFAMEGLERYKGHFLNWYDTSTGAPLLPRYVSTVDSGNLAGHIRVLCSALGELGAAPLLHPAAAAGLRDTLALVAAAGSGCEAEVAAFEALLLPPADGLQARLRWAGSLAAESRLLLAATRAVGRPDAIAWAEALHRQADALREELSALCCWAEWGESADRSFLDSATTLDELIARLIDVGSRSPERLNLLQPTLAAARQQSAVAGELRLRCRRLAAADFRFLYAPDRQLLALGYWVDDNRLEESFYDLLASEARLASFVAIAEGQLPFEHWFALGRRLTTAPSGPMLLSWSGSMFEYLMPLLVMPTYGETLLDQTYRGAVARQIAYGRDLGLPWGISESCYHATDLAGSYQYRAFGVPGLGLARGLADDRVIAPYASALALLVDPVAATLNLRELADSGWLGDYGFYEAIDFTPGRLGLAGAPALVRSAMAHHQAMSLVALGSTLSGPLMQRRFLAHVDLHAAALLLQERVPSPVAAIRLLPHDPAPAASSRQRIIPVPTVANDPGPVLPTLHLLSNGTYHLLLTAAGAGGSTIGDRSLSRWRPDTFADALGCFTYLADTRSGQVWSSTFLPTRVVGESGEAIFSEGVAEFRRRDQQIEAHTTIAVDADNNLEVRRLRLTNHDSAARELCLTAYAELILAPPLADEAHPVFSNLFVVSEWLPELGLILVSRRTTQPAETTDWAFMLMPRHEEVHLELSAECDRARFIGRNRSLQTPAALDGFGPLSDTSGATLDPCAAIRRTVRIPAGESRTVDLILGVAQDRAQALALARRYNDPYRIDHVLEVAAPQARAELAQFGMQPADLPVYEQLAAAILFPQASLRAPTELLKQSDGAQDVLWSHGLSGDLPVVLLRLTDAEHLQLLQELVQAHLFLRRRGLRFDLIVWNDDATGYRHTLSDRIAGMLTAGAESSLLDRAGGIHLRQLDTFTERDRVLLQAAATVCLSDRFGSLALQLEQAGQRTAAVTPVPRFAPTGGAPVDPLVALPLPAMATRFSNVFGGVVGSGSEYVVETSAEHPTPAPWVNVIANDRIGCAISEKGEAYTWCGNAQRFRLSPWGNDPVLDTSGEQLLLRDDTSGHQFGPIAPAGEAAQSRCRHGFGYSVFERSEALLTLATTVFVHATDPVKFLTIKVRNDAPTPRALSLLFAIDWVLGDLRNRHSLHIQTERDSGSGALLARNPFNLEFSEAVAFLDTSERERSVSGDRRDLTDPENRTNRRLTLVRPSLSNRVGAGLDPCGAIQVSLALEPGEEGEVVFVVGAGANRTETVELIARHRGVAAAKLALEQVKALWQERTGAIRCATPDPALDTLLAGWLPYQVQSARLMGRSGFYQSGGAYGFRDQLQDAMALVHEQPELLRDQIRRSAARQFTEGDVQHWWHPPAGRGVRTRCSDDLLWLPYALCRWSEATGDNRLQNEVLPYLSGRRLEPGETSAYELPVKSALSESIYDHCKRAILLAMQTGRHGLPLIGSGDWNDAMNRVGPAGQGESVWLAFFLFDLLRRFERVALAAGDAEFAEVCRTGAVRLETQVEAHAWDGGWYLRAWADDGMPIGSSGNAACQIDLLPQAWATLSGAGSVERRNAALDAAWERLVMPEEALVLLFTPPFDEGGADPGYLRGYPPGVRENGGQYTHAAVWLAMAFAEAGQADRAAALIQMLNPIHRTEKSDRLLRYRVEPWVLSADIYGAAPHTGRGGWTWYTGAAGWFYRCITESFLGLQRHGDMLGFAPCVPASWAAFEVTLLDRGSTYRIAFRQRDPSSPVKPMVVTCDGLVMVDGLVRLGGPAAIHEISVAFSAPQPAVLPEASVA